MPTHRRRPSLGAETYANPEQVFHVVIRALIARRPFVGEVAKTVWTVLMAERERSSVQLVAACLMPDHLHVLMQPGERAIPNWVASFKSYSTHRVKSNGGPRFIWQPGFYDRAVRGELEFLETLRYVLDNPAAAGLIGNGEIWPWLWSAEM